MLRSMTGSAQRLEIVKIKRRAAVAQMDHMMSVSRAVLAARLADREALKQRFPCNRPRAGMIDFHLSTGLFRARAALFFHCEAQEDGWL